MVRVAKFKRHYQIINVDKLLLLLLCTFLSSALTSSSPIRRVSSEDKNKPNFQAITAITIQSVQENNDSARSDDESYELLYYFWSLVLTACIVYITAKYTSAAFLQLEQITENTTIAIKTAQAAMRSAEIADNALNLAREASELELRAYVFISSATILNPEDPSNRIAQITIKNFGRTPAHSVRYWYGTRVDDYPDGLLNLGRPPNMPISVEILAPTRTAIMEVEIEAQTLELEAQLLNGRGAIFIFGEITYRDPFTRHVSEPKRLTRFRLISRGENIRRGRLSPDVGGNEAN
jgi:hypothetical protein